MLSSQIAEAIRNARNRNDLKYHVLNVIQRFGLSDFAIRWTAAYPNSANGWGSLPSHLMRNYLKATHVKRDIVLRHAFMSESQVFMSELAAAISGDEQDASIRSQVFNLIELSRYYGYHDFFHIPVWVDKGKLIAVCSFCAKDNNAAEFRRRIKKNSADLQSLAHAIVFHSRLNISRVASEILPSNDITPKSLALIRMQATDDLSLEKAAEILGISTRHANRCMGAARSALGVTTDSAVVYRAIQGGLID